MSVSPAISINKKCHSHHQFLASKYEWHPPKLSSRDDATPITPLPFTPPWLHNNWWRVSKNARSKVNRETELAPDSGGAYERNAFNEPRGLPLPINRTLNSLTWYLIFDVQITCSLCCKSVYSLTPPPTSSEQFSQSYWDAISQARNTKHPHKIK